MVFETFIELTVINEGKRPVTFDELRASYNLNGKPVCFTSSFLTSNRGIVRFVGRKYSEGELPSDFGPIQPITLTPKTLMPFKLKSANANYAEHAPDTEERHVLVTLYLRDQPVFGPFRIQIPADK
jgi:hypothetical protein